MSTEMDRIESYVLNVSGDHLYQSSSESFSSPSSSIGKNSDDDDGEDGVGENEAESPYKCPLDLMESLEEALPVRDIELLQWKVKVFHEFSCGCCVGVGLFIFDERLGEAGESLQSSSEEPPLPSDFRQQDDYTWKDLEETHHELEQERVGACHGGCCRGDSGTSTGTSPTITGSPPRKMMLPPLHPRSRMSFGNLESSQSSTGFCAWRSYSVADIPRCVPTTANGIGSTES
ncbi:hypothetical protein F2Q68_00000739 [Brassica cretica]|uniref:Uncharacterized protein n=1 Tax=Brassica cretica TaxID=69181 RepID=A0A8S9JGM3_BRACR|nr:hypothetical protein F2Q68_00000739 [Brassica cretica]